MSSRHCTFSPLILIAAVLFLAPLVIGLVPSQVGADSAVGGEIGSDTVWTKANSPYVVTSGVLVASGATLTIDPGVVVKFESAKGMRIDGRLIARGTSTEQITFTSNGASPAPGDWGNVLFSDASLDAAYDAAGGYISGSIMQYCTVEYAGAGDVPALELAKSSPLVDHCTIRNNSHQGIGAEGTYDAQGRLVNGLPRITNTGITNNAREGISATWNSAWSDNSGVCLISGNSMLNNSGVGVSLSYGNVNLSSNTISGNASIGIQANGSRLAINANTISSNSGPGSGCGIGLATCAASITGNTITNNQSASGSSGYEGGIHASAGTVVISGNTISGNSARTGGGIYADGLTSGSFTISGNTVSGNSAAGNGGGMAIYGNDVIVAYNNITGNSLTGGDGKAGGIFISGAPTVTGNNVHGNNPYDVSTANPQASSHVIATNNWWGTTDEALIQQHVWDWYDEASLGIIDFKPYLAVAVEADCLPSQPTNLFPTASDFGIAVPTALQSSLFSDCDAGDAHASSQWQITAAEGAATPDFSNPVFDSGPDPAHLTSIAIPSKTRSCGASYAWRVRYQDNHGAWSRWSSCSLFFIICDNTAPPTPVVHDDGEFTDSVTQLHATWSSSDEESGIAEYQYAIGMSTGATDVVPWTSAGSATQVTHAGLSLTEGQTYYFTVKARNGVDMWSAAGNSDGVTVYGASKADFSADVTAAIVGQTVHFTNRSTGSFASWRWDFGDGSTSQLKDPTHSYSVPGAYSVSLAASNAAISDTKTKIAYITVYDAVKADFAADPVRCSEGDNVTFTSLSTGGIPPISHGWDFDSDGTVDSVVQNPIQSYPAMGAYSVSLTVTDAAGDSDTQTKITYIVVTRILADQEVGPEGGIVQAANGRVKVEFPAGAVAGVSRVIIRQLPPLGIGTTPRGFRIGETCFSIEVTDAEGASITQLLTEIIITVSYSEDDLAAARGKPKRLRMGRCDDGVGEWVILDVVANEAEGTFTVSTDHLSDWAVMAKVAKPGVPLWVWITSGVVGGLIAASLAGFAWARRRAQG